MPNRPIDDPDRFIGREEQVDEAIDSLFQISQGNPKHTIITGDRGIGKSSLLLQSKLLATGDNRLAQRHGIDLGIAKYNYLVAWHDVDHGQGPSDMMIGLLKDLDSKISSFLRGLKIEINLGEFIKIAKEEEREKSITEISYEFVERIKRIYNKLQESESGILLCIDELDRAKQNSGIASFFKITCEKLARENIKRMAFFCSGITGAIQELEEEHASILRTFRDIPIPRFTKPEVAEILKTNFDKVHYQYDDQVFEKCYELTAGIPEPIHLLGSEMVSVDTDQNITILDYDNAVNKLVKDVRKNKLESLLKKAGGGKYQKILLSMAQYPKKMVPLDHIAKKLKEEQNQFSTNMSTLVKREIIIRIDAGIYTFSDPLLKEYISIFGIRNLEDEE